MTTRLLLAAIFLVLPLAARQSPAPRSNYTAITSACRKLDGFVPLYWDQHSGKMWFELAALHREMLYVSALSAGVGSNDIGLDRGRMNSPKIVQFERSGPRILLVESNYGFRASSTNPAEQRAEIDSFARSVLWGFDVAAEDNGRVLVDATAFLQRDSAGVSNALAETGQGTYQVDSSRSAFDLSLTKGFPRNTEIETTLTFTGEPKGAFIREVAPSPEAVTVREHQSFVALPEPGYRPRRHDPRTGFIALAFMDFSSPIDQPVVQHYILRHRLEKKDPSAAVSEAVSPIVYYLDPGAPEPVRSALLEGAGWWNQAFEAAGFRHAFQVKLLPPDADPMDVRYNVIQWVHRSTRGWSYGNPLADPRTGEIIKGVVTLGSLRSRQDFLIFQGLLAPYGPGNDQTSLLTATVLARLRQLAAHEVGHTLGLEHNYIASTQERASVMDYPGPRVQITADRSLDLSQAYATGIGEWDKVSIRWGYSQFPDGSDQLAALDKIVTDAARRGLTFITDADSRPLGSAHPQSHLWDNGSSAVQELEHALEVRQIALSRFGQNNLPPDAPLATLDEILVPLYYFHRYQTEAAAKVLGGNAYTYALRGDGQPVTEIVPAAEQRRALQVLLKTLSPSVLTLPERVLRLIPPRPPAYPRTRETFPNRTGVTFDPVAGAEAAADLTASLLLNGERAARLDQYHARDARNPSFPEVANALLAVTWKTPASASGLSSEVQRAVRYVVLNRFFALAADAAAPRSVQAEACNALLQIKQYGDVLAATSIDNFFRDPKQFAAPAALPPPPGQPIGEAGEGWPF